MRKLRILDEARDEYQRQRAADRLVVDDQQRRRVLALATEFPAIWRDPNTPERERKRMLALLIEDVTLIKQHQITAAVWYRGGATTTLTLPRPLTAQQLRATHPERSSRPLLIFLPAAPSKIAYHGPLRHSNG